MLSKFQADAVGDAIVGAERERQAATREAVASRVPFFYASSALAMHSHWEQAALLSQARRTALVGWHAGLLIFTWLLSWRASGSLFPQSSQAR